MLWNIRLVYALKVFDTNELDLAKVRADLERECETSEHYLTRFIAKYLQCEFDVADLLTAQKTEEAQLICCSHMYFSRQLIDNQSISLPILRKFAEKAFESFNSSTFSPVKSLDSLQEKMKFYENLDHVVDVVYLNCRKTISVFLKNLYYGRVYARAGSRIIVFNLFDREVQPENLKLRNKLMDGISYLAKKGKEGIALGMMGYFYEHGIGYKKCSETAKHYYIAGMAKKDLRSVIGLANIFRKAGDTAASNGYLNQGIFYGCTEAMYMLFLHGDNTGGSAHYLARASNKGFLPAMYRQAMASELSGETGTAAALYNAICDQCPLAVSYADRGILAFLNKEYTRSFLLTYIAGVMGCTNSMTNALHLLINYRLNIKGLHRERLIREIGCFMTDMDFTQQLVTVGRSFYYGLDGVVEYDKAYAYFYAAVARGSINKLEAAYYLSVMHRKGLGCRRSLRVSLKWLKSIRTDDSAYMLFVYELSIWTFALLTNFYFLVGLFLGVIAYCVVWKKPLIKEKLN